MASPYQYPWVDFDRQITVGIDSTPLLVFGQERTCIIDSIILCNTTDQDIFIDMKILGEEDNIPLNPYVLTKHLIPRFASTDIMAYLRSESSSQSIMYPISGDLIYLNSDFSGNKFDCIVYFRALLETA